MRRIVLDQGLPAPAAPILRDVGWDVVHVRDLGMHAASDAEILAYAARESRVVITLDRDFPQMLALLGAARPSVVLIRQQRLRATSLIQILTWNDYATHLETGSVLTVGTRGTRLRLLPIK